MNNAMAEVRYEQRKHGRITVRHTRITKAERERAREANRSTLPWSDK